MALQNFQYDIIMREYNRRQSQVQHDLEERRAEAFARVPRLLEIDGEVAALSAQKARSLLQGEPGSVDDLKKDVAALSAERRSLLKKNGFSEDYLEPHYFCPICQDTGYTGGQKCTCFKKLRSNCSIHSPISPRFSKKRTLNTFLLTGILIQ